jgi:hypothetical protein
LVGIGDAGGDWDGPLGNIALGTMIDDDECCAVNGEPFGGIGEDGLDKANNDDKDDDVDADCDGSDDNDDDDDCNDNDTDGGVS